ncbi:MAG: Resolvase protein [Firmicutes bacterium]|nr:Resolvase protein [Bacillota bacterium]
MPCAAIYLRVSTAEQAEKGYSLPAQAEACREAAKTRGVTAIEEYKDEGYSGEFIDRPAMNRLREDIKNTKYTYVICYDPDRLARNLSHQLLVTEEIEKSGAKLQFVSVAFDQSPEGKLFYAIRGAIAEFEKEKIRQRTCLGKRRKALQGKLIFNDSPFGYAYNAERCNYIIIEHEAATIRLFFDLIIKNHYGVRSLAYELKALGITNRSGRRFSGPVLYKMLTNEMYAGTKWAFKTLYKTIDQHKVRSVRRDKSEWIPISVPAIVTVTEFDQVQTILQKNKKFSRRNTIHPYLLRNIIKCSACGYSMTGTKITSKGKDFFYYVCTSKNEKRPCTNRYIPSDFLDDAAWRLFSGILTAEEPLGMTATTPTPQYHTYIEQQKTKQATILAWLSDGLIDIEPAQLALQKLAKETASLNTLLNLPPPLIGKLSPPVAATTFEQKRTLFLHFGFEVFAFKNPAGATSFYIQQGPWRL